MLTFLLTVKGSSVVSSVATSTTICSAVELNAVLLNICVNEALVIAFADSEAEALPSPKAPTPEGGVAVVPVIHSALLNMLFPGD
jgi:hypothetical protein